MKTDGLVRTRRLMLATALIGGFAAVVASAPANAAFPEKPITIVVGYGAGGANDILARVYAEKLQATLGQTVIVENKPGVASILGAGFVAHAKPDGYTLLMGASGPMTFNYALYKKLPYTAQDFAPISLMGNFPLVLLANKDSSANTVKELVAYSKQHPDKANYSSSAASFQLMTELFNDKTGGRFTHVPYKGSAEAVTAVMSGDVTMSLVDSGPATNGLRSGKLKALAVTSPGRMPSLPDVPTLKETGVDLEVTLWSGLLAPAGTPPEVIQRLNEAVVSASKSPEVIEKLNALAITAQSSTPEAFGKLIARESAQWKDVAKKAGIEPQ